MSQAAYAFANVSAASTDALVVTGITNRQILVLGLSYDCTAAATDITFNSKGSGSGTAISCLFSMSQNNVNTLPVSEFGWMITNSGESLTCTTSNGSTTGIQVVYRYVNVPGSQS